MQAPGEAAQQRSSAAGSFTVTCMRLCSVYFTRSIEARSAEPATAAIGLTPSEPETFVEA